jgi:hypothetical protein
MTEELKQSVKNLCDALRADKTEGSYYYSWQANIAMAFHDVFNEMMLTGEIKAKFENSFTFHDCCNNAAKRFLDLLTHIPEPEKNNQ